MGSAISTGKGRNTAADSIAQFRLGARRAPVDGHERTKRHVGWQVVLPKLLVAPYRTCQGREQHVVDRPAQPAPNRLDLRQRDWPRPGDPLGHTWHAPERRIGIRWREHDIAHGSRRISAQLGAPNQLGAAPEMAEGPQPPAHQPSRRPASDPGPRAPDRIGAASCVRLLRTRPGLRASGIGQRQEHMNHRHAVGQAVVRPANEGAAGAIPLDQVHLPRRPGHVKGGAGQLTDDLLQSSVIAWRRQGDSLHVVIEIQTGIVLPRGSPPGQSRSNHPLSEAVDAQEAGLDRRLDLLRVNRRPQDHDRRDHHRVDRVVHAQQDGIQV